MEFRPLRVAVGFSGALVVLGALFWFVGFDSLGRAFAVLEPRWLLLVGLAGVAWLVSWGLALRRVLGSLGVETSVPRAALLFASAEFANNVTPFGQAGGEPFSALLVSRATDTGYESGLAAVTSVDAINLVPSLVFATVGMGYYVATFTVDADVRRVAVAVAVLAICVPLLLVLLWANRFWLERRVASGVAVATRGAAGVVPGVRPVSRADALSRLDVFVDALERVGRDPRDLAVAVCFSAVGWLCMCLALYLSVRALAVHGFPAVIALVVVPVAMLAAGLPLPGGEGGVEAALAFLLVPMASVSPVTAVSAALVFRVGTYWLSTLLGGLAAAMLGSAVFPSGRLGN